MVYIIDSKEKAIKILKNYIKNYNGLVDELAICSVLHIAGYWHSNPYSEHTYRYIIRREQNPWLAVILEAIRTENIYEDPRILLAIRKEDRTVTTTIAWECMNWADYTMNSMMKESIRKAIVKLINSVLRMEAETMPLDLPLSPI